MLSCRSEQYQKITCSLSKRGDMSEQRRHSFPTRTVFVAFMSCSVSSPISQLKMFSWHVGFEVNSLESPFFRLCKGEFQTNLKIFLLCCTLGQCLAPSSYSSRAQFKYFWKENFCLKWGPELWWGTWALESETQSKVFLRTHVTHHRVSAINQMLYTREKITCHLILYYLWNNHP